MGLYKNKGIEFADRGYRDSDKFICASHFSDDYIVKQIKYSHNKGKCSFCNKKKNVLPFNMILELVSKVVDHYYPLALDEAMYDSEDKEYLDSVIDPTSFVYFELNEYLGVDCEDVLDELIDTLNYDDRVYKYSFLERQEEIDLEIWNRYCDLVKSIPFSAEQIISLTNKPSSELTENINNIHATLDMVWNHCKELFLVKTYFGLSSGYSSHNYYRCVKHLPIFDTKLSEYAGLTYIPAMLVGTAPAKAVKNNRMSEAGDMMFYGADDNNTAMIEVECSAGEIATIGTFNSNKRFMLLDLFKIDDWKCPSIFDIDSLNKRSSWFFLNEFINIISKAKPFDKADENFYKPTQVFTKYIQRKTNAQGIKFKSSKTGKGCYVLFVVDRDCVDKDDKTQSSRNQLVMTNVEQIEVK